MIAAAVQTQHENHRTAQDRRCAHGPCGQVSGFAQDPHRVRGLIAERAIAEHADEGAAIQPFSDLQHGIDMAERNDVGRVRGTDGR